MPYLIDGHNLIPKVPGLRLDDPDDEEQLLEWLQTFARARRQKIEVYFDQAAPGHAGAHRLGLITAHFVPAPQTADDAIRRRLKKLGKSARNWKVVSSDRGVQAEVRAAQATVVESGEFADLLVEARRAGSAGPEGTSPGLSAKEVEDWLELFRRGKK
ncbi:MAG TPA: NYN domain-containing protein [Anaerolineaceae bacterium]|nr:NYN domain-containing protein [Anaerolineaceae bacterium]